MLARALRVPAGMRLCPALLVLSLTGCIVGDDPADEEIGASYAGANLRNGLRWSGFTSNCVKLGSGIAATGADLAVFFDTGSASSDCTLSGVIGVPPGTWITSVAQDIRTGGDATTIRYTARFGGAQITSRTGTARAGIHATADVRALGARLCAQAGTAVRTVAFSFDVSVAGADAYLDTVDWLIGVAPCP